LTRQWFGFIFGVKGVPPLSKFSGAFMLMLRIIVCVIGLATASAALAANDGDYKDLYRRGVEHNKKGEFDEAIRFYSKAIALKPDSASLYFVRGRAYEQNKQYDNAIRDLGKAIALKPDYAEAYNIRGVTYLVTTRKQLAEADFKKACSMGLKEACTNLK
jgi:tetratricopeptide (TPR) repeat protein